MVPVMGALRPGQMLDGNNYRVIRELGAGGMGVVYEVEHVRIGKRYVAKLIHEQIKDDEAAPKRMEREWRVLADISHPNIVQVHDGGTTPEGMSYFVMEKLEGVDLRSTMKHGLTRLRSIEVITDVLDALAYVHQRGIVHRDIKPENIFLAEQARGTVTKVLDFGIVHIFDKDGLVSRGRITKTGGFVGTLYYAAPEQMQGKPATPPNDVYATGLVLFELLAGKGPFDDDPGVGLSRCFQPAPRLTELVPQAPRALSDALAKALEQDPTRRPPAGALAEELRAVAATLRSDPQVAADEAIRAEVHDLLRRIPLVDSGPRPAAGRMPTPERPAQAPAPSAAEASLEPPPEATVAPTTPVMAGAPGRTASAPHASLDATLASATGEAHASGTHDAPRPAAGQPHADTANGPNASAPPAPMPPAMPVATSHGLAQPTSSWPGPAAAPSVPPGPVPPAAPRLPSGAELAVAEARTGDMHAGTSPLFATATAPPQHTGAPRQGRAHRADTSPGVYATVDDEPRSTPPRRRTPLPTIALASGGVVALVAMVIGGAFALRERSASTSAATTTSSATTLTSVSPAGVPSAPEPEPEPASTPTASATVSETPSAREAAIATASTALPSPKAAAPVAPATSQRPARAATPSTPQAKPAAPRATSAGRAAEKDGYVNTF